MRLMRGLWKEGAAMMVDGVSARIVTQTGAQWIGKVGYRTGRRVAMIEMVHLQVATTTTVEIRCQ